MRNEYYKFLFEQNVLNYLDEIEDLSYSRKLKILEKLKKFFSSEDINRGLIKYKNNYIDLKRAEIPKLENTLKGLCKIK